MKNNKKINYSIVAVILFSVFISGFYCTRVPEKKSAKTQMTVTVDNIASNDLGQVVVFGTSDGSRTMFVKSFYKSGKKQKTIQTDIHKYLKEISPIKGKNVIINYRKNNIGDMEILDIEQ